PQAWRTGSRERRAPGASTGRTHSRLRGWLRAPAAHNHQTPAAADPLRLACPWCECSHPRLIKQPSGCHGIATRQAYDYLAIHQPWNPTMNRWTLTAVATAVAVSLTGCLDSSSDNDRDDNGVSAPI